MFELGGPHLPPFADSTFDCQEREIGSWLIIEVNSNINKQCQDAGSELESESVK